jgi:NAD-dependent deacetylase
MMQEQIRKAAQIILGSRNLVAFAGAGLSQESGIPTFRGDEGIWKNYLPIIYGNPAGLFLAFALSPGKLQGFISSAVGAFIKAEPNPGHLALAELSKAGILKAIITQNIDDLERRAGAKKIIQLHGNIYVLRCIKCREIFGVSRENLLQILDQLKPGMGRKELLRLGRRFSRCPNCRGYRRPDIVFFGESLNEEEFFRAAELGRSADVLIIAGTSGVVYPAALLPNYAAKAGARIIEVNPEPSSLSGLAEIKIRNKCAVALPAIVQAISQINPQIFDRSKAG